MSGAPSLRDRRVALGLTLADVAEQTRIAEAHLEAIENRTLDLLPEGPYRAGYVRAYCAFLDVDPDPALLEAAGVVPALASRRPTVAHWPARFALLGVMVVLAALLAWQLMPADPASTPPGPDGTAGAVSNTPDQEVTIEALQTAHFVVVVDGELALDRRVAGGETLEVAGHRRVEVQLEGADTARVIYNGEAIVPQGRQDVPRRLVFIDDLDPED